MKIKKLFTSLLLSCIVLFSCTKIEDADLINPNYPLISSADVDLYLNDIENRFSKFYDGASDLSSELTRQQVWYGPSYTNAYQPSRFDDVWQDGYQALYNIDLMTSVATTQKKWRHVGIGYVLKAYILGTLVDCFGSVPFEEAGLAAQNLNPKLQTGDKIYQAMIKFLDTGINFLSRTDFNGAANQENIYKGDTSLWKRAALTLKAKFLFQTRLVNPQALDLAENILNNGRIISETSHDLNFKYGTTQNAPDSRHPQYANNYNASSVGGVGEYIPTYFMWALCAEKRGQNAGGSWKTSSITIPSTTDNFDDPRRRYMLCRQVVDYSGVTFQNASCSEEPKPAHFTDPKLPFCFPASSGGYWGRDHGDNSGTPPDGPLRTTYGLYPCGGKFDNLTAATRALIGQGALGAGILPIWNSEFTLFLRSELSLVKNNQVTARTYLRDAVERSILKVQNFNSAVGYTLPTSDTNLLLNTPAKRLRYINLVLSRYDAATNNDERLEVIMKEFYLALWGNGIEVYNNYRRSGKPGNMPDPKTAAQGVGNLYMRSFLYPSNYINRNLNAVSQKVPGSQVQKVFWDTNPDNFIK